jgi:hypothetical protein
MVLLNSRIRFYVWCDLSQTTVDYCPDISDLPEYPRDSGIDIFADRYKSVFGSNYWNYSRGVSSYWNMSWEDVSDNCQATMGMIVGSLSQSSPHIAIWQGPGLHNITLGSLLSLTGTELCGTYFCENDQWAPKERIYGNWGFDTKFRREA